MAKEPDSLQSQAYEMIRERSIFADYTPGMKLGIKELCEELELGRTPVRESFLRLAQEDLVESVPQSGTYVSKINMRYAEAARLSRECLEREIIAECCARIDATGLERIDELICAQQEALDADDKRAFFESDNAMHAALYDIAGRPVIWQWLNLTNTHFERFRWLSAITKGVDPEEVVGQHRQMRRALATKDVNYASYLVSDHLQKSRYDYDKIVAEHPDYFADASPFGR